MPQKGRANPIGSDRVPCFPSHVGENSEVLGRIRQHLLLSPSQKAKREARRLIRYRKWRP